MTKALGKDIWDFYLNGWPQEYSHDSYDREVAYWPGWESSEGAYSLLEDNEEYDLCDFGICRHDFKPNTYITFEEAYLKWKGIEKSKMLTFDEWFDTNFIGNDEATKILCEKVWYAAIASTKEN